MQRGYIYAFVLIYSLLLFNVGLLCFSMRISILISSFMLTYTLIMFVSIYTIKRLDMTVIHHQLILNFA